MQLHDFTFDLPAELIAQLPLAERSASRLLVLDRDAAPLRDATMRDLPALLAPGDLLVLNDTRVIAARVIGRKATGGRVEVFLERITGADTALVQLRASKAIRAGLAVHTAAGEVRILEPRGDLWEVRTPGPALAFFEEHGAVPLPPYIQRPAGSGDKERYQSIFARDPGAVAAPTASLHFDAGLVALLAARGVERTFITLHVGAGTFQPVRTPDLSRHVLHAERVIVGEDACEAIARTRQRGGRVIAVGTTVVRALEAAALQKGALEAAAPQKEALEAAALRAAVLQKGALEAAALRAAVLQKEALQAAALEAAAPQKGVLRPWAGDTRLFIRPGFEFQVIDGLLTNFHLPESTLLMLVCAFAGRERVLAAYEHAVRSRYRFFSYGDAMLVTPAPRT